MLNFQRETILRLAMLAFGLAALAFSSAATADTYTYDAYGRLIGVAYADGSSVTYTYDPAGNRTVVTQVATP